MFEPSLMTCRFCGKWGHDHKDFVKYGVRHYAHHDCYLKAGKPLADLHSWQIGTFPYRVLQKHNMVKAASELLNERQPAVKP